MLGIDNNNTTEKLPPIVLQLCDKPAIVHRPLDMLPDCFEKEIIADEATAIPCSDDKFEKTDDEQEPKRVIQSNKVGAGINPKTVLPLGKRIWNAIKKVWFALDIYDTMDGWRERLHREPKGKDIETEDL